MKSAPLYSFGLRMGRGCSLQENKLAVTRKRGIGTAIHTPSFMLPWALQFSHQIRSSWRTRTRPAYPFTPSPSAGPNTQKFPDPSQLKTWLTSHCQSKITRKELPRPPLPEQETLPPLLPASPLSAGTGVAALFSVLRCLTFVSLPPVPALRVSLMKPPILTFSHVVCVQLGIVEWDSPWDTPLFELWVPSSCLHWSVVQDPSESHVVQ